MFQKFTRSLVLSQSVAVAGLGLLVFGFERQAQAQALEQLSEILQSQSSPQASTDELPAPQNSPPTDPLEAIGGPSDDEAARRIYLGLEAEELPSVKGLRVATVTRDSPAWKSGFQVDDKIIGINGFSITKMSDMIEQLGKAAPGQSVKFLINRDKRTLELTSVLISQAMAQQLFSRLGESQNDAAWIGLTVHDLTPAFREQFGLGTYRGAAVSQVVTGSPAHRSGIRAGDAITEVDARPIESAADFAKWLELVRPGDQVSMIVYRGIARIPTQVVLSSEPRVQPTQPGFTPMPPRPRIAKENARGGIVNQVSPPSQSPASSEFSGSEPPENRLPEDDAALDSASPRERELQREVERLKRELAEAQTKLNETRQQLNSILKALRD